VSDHIREHKDDYIPFLETELEVYLEELERGAAWGGHVEILALTRVFGRDVEVWKSDGPLRVGENGGECLRVSFHRFYFGLGEHYNSLRKLN
jgi:OTU domain-containing protein 6